MSFDRIRDQEVPVKLLRNMLTRNRLPHGLLFWGAGGVGKRLTAMETAKAVCCERLDFDACNQCLPCRKIQNGNHPDLTVLAPVKKSRIIDVEAVEGINELASLRPYESSRRIFLILEADRMGIPAQNHLLKTLEEPPGPSLFILVTEHPRSLLPTIRSRCQQLRFGALRPESVVELLHAETGMSGEEAESIAALAQGQMSRALDLVRSEKRTRVLEFTQRLADGEDPLDLASEFTQYIATGKSATEAAIKEGMSKERLSEMRPEDREELAEEQKALVEALVRYDILEHLYLFATWYRDALVYRATGDTARVLNRDQQARLEMAAPADFARKIDAIEKARLYLERYLKEDRVFRDLFFALAR